MCLITLCFFFKQKTEYEMRISDWSSDVCSSDLTAVVPGLGPGTHWHQHRGHDTRLSHQRLGLEALHVRNGEIVFGRVEQATERAFQRIEIGRASCRERVCQYV